MADPPVDITVLVPVCNESANLGVVVDAMRAQSFEGSVEYLFLDGGSADSTVSDLLRLAGEDPRFRVVERPGSNVPTRLNLGLRLARGELIARMDAHAIFPSGYLAVGSRRLSRGDVASVSGPQIASGRGRWSRRIAIALRSPLGRGGAQFRQLSPDEVEVDSGYCGIWRRSLIVAHGGWDERAEHGEDMELATRIVASGGRIVCIPDMAARYLPRESLLALARQYGRYAHRRAWAARRHPSALRRSHVLPPAVLLALVSARVAPGPVARPAKAASKLYALAVIAESIRVGRGERLTDALSLPAVFVTMHLAWGAGFLVGCAHHGVPWAALRAVGSRRVSRGRQTRP